MLLDTAHVGAVAYPRLRWSVEAALTLLVLMIACPDEQQAVTLQRRRFRDAVERVRSDGQPLNVLDVQAVLVLVGWRSVSASVSVQTWRLLDERVASTLADVGQVDPAQQPRARKRRAAAVAVAGPAQQAQQAQRVQQAQHAVADAAAAVESEADRRRASPRTIKRLKQTIKQLQRRVFYWRRKAGRLSKTVADLKGDMQALKGKRSYVIRSARRKVASNKFHVTVVGGFRLALQRNIRHCGAEALSATVEAGVTRRTVNSWELLLASAIVVRSRAWYDAADAYLVRQLER